MVKSTVYKSDNSGSGSTMAVRRDAQSVDTVQASSAAAAAAAMGTEDATAEMDEG